VLRIPTRGAADCGQRGEATGAIAVSSPSDGSPIEDDGDCFVVRDYQSCRGRKVNFGDLHHTTKQWLSALSDRPRYYGHNLLANGEFSAASGVHVFGRRGDPNGVQGQ
jgi:hypothetical protein